ncbi:hypothetical protein NHX12_027946 [Muraenolepis orangiensis]|uniref:Uncharacterized protein n=1 Tax=Muraenolepis orangiensis TaxID=630683 RepID=A0A9Q0EGM6_9TELE|nr:hypothetical protein NHX12_027946 [Muraenolepis orangiensis]
MQVGCSRLSMEERDQRFRDRLCLYSGQAGRLIRTCPKPTPDAKRPGLGLCSSQLVVRSGGDLTGPWPISWLCLGVALGNITSSVCQMALMDGPGSTEISVVFVVGM